MACVFCLQAFLRVILQIHCDTIMQHEVLREKARRLEAEMQATWGKMYNLLQSTRCMVNFFGNLL